METKQIPDVLAISSPLRVIEVNPQADSRWETLMTNLPASPVYYHPAWLQVVVEAYGYKLIHLACEDATGQLVGILPLFFRHGLRSGRSFSSVLTGPLAYNDQATAALMQAAVERTRVESGARLSLKTMCDTLENQVQDMVGVPAYKTYVLALPEQPDLLHLDPPIKRAINKATRQGVQVRQAQTERELRAWYGIYVETMRKFTALPRPYHFFELAWRRLHPRGLVRLLLAEHVEAGHRKLVAGFFLPMWGRTVSYASAGWRQEDQALRPNDVLHWQAIQDAITEGFRWYDFGDVDLDNVGLARYKSKWGADEKMVYDYSYPTPRQVVMNTSEPSTNPARQLVHVAWQHMPVKAIGLLSDWYHALHLY